MRRTRTIVLMSAIVPTIGHEALVNFATKISPWNTMVIISGLRREPVTLSDRVSAFMDRFPEVGFYYHDDDNAPQNPSGPDDVEFWDYWKKTISKFVGTVYESDVFVASELYGMKLADMFGCKFIPFDLERTLLPVKGTDVRANIIQNWDNIMPAFRKRLKKTITFFGAESCGKTTMAKQMAKAYDAPFVAEWARPYLEAVGSEITEEKMRIIGRGQYALQLTAQDDVRSFFTFQDTDLLSTIGYYKIWGKEPPNDLIIDFNFTRSDLYIVMNDQIPFEPDPLRYGGDKRESTTEFWVKLLDTFKCKYHVVQNTSFPRQENEIFTVLDELEIKTLTPIEKFVRD